MLLLVIERFRDDDPVPVYRRFRERGRMAPDGLRFVSSWVEEEFRRCWQIWETDDPALLDDWMRTWNDLVDFEVHPVMTGDEAVSRITPRL